MPKAVRRRRRLARRGSFKTKVLRRAAKRNFNKKVKRVMRSEAEHKFVRQPTITVTALGPGQQTLALYPTPEDAGGEGFVGYKFNITRIRVRWTLTFPDTTNLVRLIVFAWRQELGTPTTNDLFEDGTGSAFDMILSQPSVDSLRKRKMKWMIDRTYVGGTGGSLVAGTGTPGITTGVGPLIRGSWDFHGRRLPKKNITMAGAGADPNWFYYVMALSDSLAAPSPLFAYQTVLSYTDD